MTRDLDEDRAPSNDLRQVRSSRGGRPGDRYVRIVEPFAESFRRQAPGHLVASERVLAPTGTFGRGTELLRRIVIGRRIATERDIHERIGPIKGLAVFASDNISSSAYASEEIMRVLVAAGAGALALTMPLTVGIVLVLAIVVISYQQTIRAYPSGGGSYWEYPLHNQSALRLKLRLFFRPNTVVIDVPYHLGRDGRSTVPVPPQHRSGLDDEIDRPPRAPGRP